MKALLLTPTAFPKLTGNAVTVDRIARNLEETGIVCRILDLSSLQKSEIRDEAFHFQPDLVHAFHAYKSGRIALPLIKRLRSRMVTTMTGTDLNVDLLSVARKKIIVDVLEQSDAVTVFNEHGRSILLQEGLSHKKIFIIHQSVSLPESAPRVNFRFSFQIDPNAVLFLLLGAVRRIKNYGCALSVLKKVKKRFPAIHLVIAGPVMEPAEFKKIRLQFEGEKWITYAGEISREDVPSLLLSADIVLNTSWSESENNALLEAMKCKRIVIGRDIPGNASLLSGKTGFVFRDDKELYDQIVYVIKNLENLDSIRNRAAEHVRRHFSNDKETADYLALYKNILKKT